MTTQRIPTAIDFRNYLTTILAQAESFGFSAVEITSGTIHRAVGGYPEANGNHRMPDCCAVMQEVMGEMDIVVDGPPSTQGASLRIRYQLPRS